MVKLRRIESVAVFEQFWNKSILAGNVFCGCNYLVFVIELVSAECCFQLLHIIIQKMLIEKTTNGSVLNVLVSGRLDALTAPEFEKEITVPQDGQSELVLDFAQLEYVSSAGLRSILSLKKQVDAAAGIKLKLINVVPDVMEVFEMTGFSSLLTIESAA
ncbi:MAG: STAS domain-containing protein [Planctomycetaceae bacterium]|jgi:anti-sigma B factor antagonist|nr:STAS domain-containing protein [Planctomycetaceae bacterium]